MQRIAVLIAFLLFTCRVNATDVTLLVGYQYNDEFELSDEVADLPPGSVGGVPGDDIDVDGGAVFGLALEFDIFDDPNQRIGFYLGYHEASFDDDAGLEDDEMGVTHLHFTGMNYYPRGNWEHFVMAGIGATYFDPEDSTLDSDLRFSVQVGGGTNYRLTETLLLRVDARWIPAFFNGSTAGICSGGCVIAVKGETYSQFQVNAGLMFRF